MIEKKISAAEMLAQVHQYWPTEYEPINRFTYYLYRVKELSQVQLQMVMRRYDLTATEFDILTALRNTAEPHILSPTELRHSMLITSGGLTKLLHGLEARGLIQRTTAEQDKRSKLAHLSTEGCTTIEAAMEAVLTYDNDWISSVLDNEELAQLNHLMEKLNNKLEQRLFG